VLSFQQYYEAFANLKCTVAFVATDTKHALWHWTNIPPKYGGVGRLKFPLMSDSSRSMCRDWGVLSASREEREVPDHSLRGMYIVDGEGLLRQVRPLI
jgi:alkyl hydroperoxide reductase subunit AhpC